MTGEDRWSGYKKGETWKPEETYWCCSARHSMFNDCSAHWLCLFVYMLCILWFLFLSWHSHVLFEQVLFNNTIFHNIQYGCLSSTPEEVYSLAICFYLQKNPVSSFALINRLLYFIGIWCCPKSSNSWYYHEVPRQIFYSCWGARP